MTRAPRLPITRQPANAPSTGGRKSVGRGVQVGRAQTEAGIRRAITSTKPPAEQPSALKPRARKPRAKGKGAAEQAGGITGYVCEVGHEGAGAPAESPRARGKHVAGEQSAPVAPAGGADEGMFLSIREIPPGAVPAPSGFGYRSDGTLGGAPDSVNNLLRDATARAAGGASLAEIFENRTRGPVAPPVLGFSAAPASANTPSRADLEREADCLAAQGIAVGLAFSDGTRYSASPPTASPSAGGVAASLHALETPAASSNFSLGRLLRRYPILSIAGIVAGVAALSLLLQKPDFLYSSTSAPSQPKVQAEQSVPSEQAGIVMPTELVSSIDYLAVRDRLFDVRDRIQSLYSDAVAATPTAGGKVTFVLKVNGNGTVASVSVESKDDSLPQEFVASVSALLLSLNGFPVSSDSYPVTVPYRFGQAP